MKNLLKNYNTKDSLLVISSFPNPTNGKYGKREFSAMGGHSERFLPYLAKKRKVIVCAEESGQRKYFSPINNLLVARIWKKGNIPSFISLMQFILALNNVKSILVQFEFNVLGGIIPNLVLLGILFLLRLTGRTVTFELHQVIIDIAKLEKHIQITNPLAQIFFNVSLSIFYALLGLIANNIIVFEQELKNKLENFVHSEKIEVLSLPEPKKTLMDKKEARRKAHLSQKEFIVMVFGFINGYKGIDWIVKALKNEGHNNIRLLIAGGENPYLKDKAFYQKFYNGITDEIAKHAHITHTGFVPDHKIGMYYSAADLVVMPYEVFMSASGPFSLTLSYGAPILISENLSDYAKSDDFTTALVNANLTAQDIIFPLTKNGLLKRLYKAKQDTTYLSNLATFSQTLGRMRSIEKIATNLDSILFSKKSFGVLTAGHAPFYSIQ